MSLDVGTSKGGAPRGNQNAAKGKRWREAVLRALSRAHKSVDGGLDVAADKLVALAAEGDKWAIDHIADRLDGKPKQESIVTGEMDEAGNGGPVLHRVIFGRGP